MPKLDKLTPERRQQLKEYLDSLQEIHKEIQEILGEANMSLKEVGGNKSTGLKMNERKKNK